ncbi:terminase [Chromohalobacter canadensis]|uniref:phage terminase small subunit n=1 Tax=Chromohalobacter canadensis TaxID=141389 RepID=UPI0021BE422E|nr:phage terminase small subunit [Chromohalobacter canadensis]MCT8469464.1 terminase [Chromohalobacter canadensis]MCT8472088.1 terminase [Chromohalobacter canadensis]MCT8499799.1 terminase [Chromohalobacter canadensis]
MVSSIRRHYERVSAAQAARDAGDAPMQGDEYHFMQAKLFEDYRRLKSVQSIERKVAIKREILPDYTAYVDGVLEAGQGAQDEVLMRVLLWRIDIGDIEGALSIGRYALRYGLEPGDQFQRSTAAILVEEAADQALALGDDDATLLEALQEIEHLTEGADMHDQIRAKLHKALGNAHRAEGVPQEALTHFRRSLALNERAGVKKDIERLEREVKNAADQNAGDHQG